nr:unnamed protein product [Spirometra erinaceieuropaei]
MFRRNKRSETAAEKSVRKFFAHKDIPQRIKHLKNLVKNLPTSQIQKFFSDYHSQIFCTFFDSFDSEVRPKCDVSAASDAVGISCPVASSVIAGGDSSESQQLQLSPPTNEDATQQQDQPPLISIGRIRQAVSGYFAEHSSAGNNNVGLEPVLPVPPKGTVEYTGPMISRVRDVLYCCRQNVDLLNSIFYHASLLPLDRYKALSCLALVYRFWIEENPVFMQPNDPLQSAPTLKRSSNRGVARRRDASVDSACPRGSVDSNVGRIRVLSRGANIVPPFGGGGSGGDPELRRTTEANNLRPSDTLPSLQLRTNFSQEGQNLPSEFHQEVGGCLQSTFQSMIINLSHVFLRSCPPPRVVQLCLVDGEVEARVNYLRQQISLCSIILEKVVQPMTLQKELRTDSWEKLLLTMLQIISEIMSTISSTDRFDLHWMSNEKLLAKFFQTFNTSLIYATLSAPISNEPWDKCLGVYSQITRFPALIEEWSNRRNDRLVSNAVQPPSSVSQVNSRAPRSPLPGSGVQLSRDSRPVVLRPSLEVPANSQPTAPTVQTPAVQPGSSASATGAHSSSETPFSPSCSQAVSGDTPSSRFDEDPFAAFGDFQPSESVTASATYAGAAGSRERRPHDLAGSWNLETEEVDSGDGDILLSPSDIDDWENLEKSGRQRSNTNTSGASAASRLKSSNSTDYTGEVVVSSDVDNALSSSKITEDVVLTPEGKAPYLRPQPRRRTSSEEKDSSTLVLCPRPSELLPPLEQPRAKSCEHGGSSADHRPLGNTSSTSGNGALSYALPEISSGEDNRFDAVPVTEFEDMMNPTLKMPPSSQLNGGIPQSGECSVLLGGTVRGWTADSAVVCWRRFLGLLGDFSCIARPSVLLDVLVSVDRLVRDLLAIDTYQALLVVDGHPRPPSDRVPIDFLCPVLLKAR